MQIIKCLLVLCVCVLLFSFYFIFLIFFDTTTFSYEGRSKCVYSCIYWYLLVLSQNNNFIDWRVWNVFFPGKNKNKHVMLKI